MTSGTKKYVSETRYTNAMTVQNKSFEYRGHKNKTSGKVYAAEVYFRRTVISFGEIGMIWLRFPTQWERKVRTCFRVRMIYRLLHLRKDQQLESILSESPVTEGKTK